MQNVKGEEGVAQKKHTPSPPSLFVSPKDLFWSRGHARKEIRKLCCKTGLNIGCERDYLLTLTMQAEFLHLVQLYK